jgi:hypothetical protein
MGIELGWSGIWTIGSKTSEAAIAVSVFSPKVLIFAHASGLGNAIRKLCQINSWHSLEFCPASCANPGHMDYASAIQIRYRHDPSSKSQQRCTECAESQVHAIHISGKSRASRFVIQWRFWICKCEQKAWQTQHIRVSCAFMRDKSIRRMERAPCLSASLATEYKRQGAPPISNILYPTG